MHRRDIMSPTLYGIFKIKLRELIDSSYNLNIPFGKESYYEIKQGDNMMFRQIRLVTGHTETFNPYIIFVDCKGFHNDKDTMHSLLSNGFYVNGVHYDFTERSASMCRNGIIGFIDSSIRDKLDDIISMDLDLDKTVISKYTAYRGLMFSSCFFIEGELPNIVIVDDYERIIPNQHIKYVEEEENIWKDNDTGEERRGTSKKIVEGYKNVGISPADGAGIHCPEISEYIAEKIGITGKIPSIYMLRMPFFKGLTIEVDFKRFYNERGIDEITDIWGVNHKVQDIDCIWTKSMYKGYKYFMKDKKYKDWERYKEKFKKYNHCLGITKWNFRTEQEPIYTRVNYQYLQTLKFEKDDIISLADYSKAWVEKIIDGDDLYTYKFLGMISSLSESSNKYMEAIRLNKGMLKDYKVKQYLFSLLKKYIDDFKMGKIWIKGCFKIIIPDIIALMEYAGGLNVNGCLEEGEFYGYGLDNKEYLIDRNPHICPSEHVILNRVTNQNIKDYLSHLENICMLNTYDITLSRLNGADVDKLVAVPSYRNVC